MIRIKRSEIKKYIGTQIYIGTHDSGKYFPEKMSIVVTYKAKPAILLEILPSGDDPHEFIVKENGDKNKYSLGKVEFFRENTGDGGD